MTARTFLMIAWLGFLGAFLSTCKSPSAAFLEEQQLARDSTIAFLKSEKLTEKERARLMEASKNCFIDSIQFAPSGKQIRIRNGSFELALASYRTGFFPKEWVDPAPFKNESPIDIQPGSFACWKSPIHGRGYVGMVGRDNDTNESIGQILTEPLEAGKLYEWSLFACKSEQYESLSRKTGKPSSFTKPMILRIWGGKKEGRAEQLFAQTGPIENTGWQKICFVLKPKSPCESLFIEAAHSELIAPGPYNGNVLIDAVGPVREIGAAKN